MSARTITAADVTLVPDGATCEVYVPSIGAVGFLDFVGRVDVLGNFLPEDRLSRRPTMQVRIDTREHTTADLVEILNAAAPR